MRRLKSTLLTAVLVAALIWAPQSVQAAAGPWTGTWSASPQSGGGAIGPWEEFDLIND